MACKAIQCIEVELAKLRSSPPSATSPTSRNSMLVVVGKGHLKKVAEIIRGNYQTQRVDAAGEMAKIVRRDFKHKGRGGNHGDDKMEGGRDEEDWRSVVDNIVQVNL